MNFREANLNKIMKNILPAVLSIVFFVLSIFLLGEGECAITNAKERRFFPVYYDDNACRVGDVWADENDPECVYFFYCESPYSVIHKGCPPAFRFNSDRGICDWSENVICSVTDYIDRRFE